MLCIFTMLLCKHFKNNLDLILKVKAFQIYVKVFDKGIWEKKLCLYFLLKKYLLNTIIKKYSFCINDTLIF